jgi:hypothetical protein
MAAITRESGPRMINTDLNVVEVSSEAALELEELKQHVRDDAPAFEQFFKLIRKPSPAFAGNGVRMFSDVQHYFKSSISTAKVPHAGDDLRTLVERFLSDLELGVASRNLEKIDEAKRFCLAINESLLTRRMDDIFSRKENADSRYINHESNP